MIFDNPEWGKFSEYLFNKAKSYSSINKQIINQYDLYFFVLQSMKKTYIHIPTDDASVLSIIIS